MKKLCIILLAAGCIQANLVQAFSDIVTLKYSNPTEYEERGAADYPPGYLTQLEIHKEIAGKHGIASVAAQNHAALINWLVENHRSMQDGGLPVLPPQMLEEEKTYNDTEKFFQGVGRFVKGATNVVKESTQAGISAAQTEIHKELDRPEHEMDDQLRSDIKDMVTHLGDTAIESVENSSNVTGEIAEHGIYQLVDHAAGKISDEELVNNLQDHAQEQFDDLNEKTLDMAGRTVTNVSHTTGSILTNPSIAASAENDGSDEAMMAAQLSAEAGQALMDNSGMLGETVTSIGQQANDLGKSFREESDSYFDEDFLDIN